MKRVKIIHNGTEKNYLTTTIQERARALLSEQDFTTWSAWPDGEAWTFGTAGQGYIDDFVRAEADKQQRELKPGTFVQNNSGSRVLFHKGLGQLQRIHPDGRLDGPSPAIRINVQPLNRVATNEQLANVRDAPEPPAGVTPERWAVRRFLAGGILERFCPWECGNSECHLCRIVTGGPTRARDLLAIRSSFLNYPGMSPEVARALDKDDLGSHLHWARTQIIRRRLEDLNTDEMEPLEVTLNTDEPGIRGAQVSQVIIDEAPAQPVQEEPTPAPGPESSNPEADALRAEIAELKAKVAADVATFKKLMDEIAGSENFCEEYEEVMDRINDQTSDLVQVSGRWLDGGRIALRGTMTQTVAWEYTAEGFRINTRIDAPPLLEQVQDIVQDWWVKEYATRGEVLSTDGVSITEATINETD